jgi:phage/plasmid-associated DNA primase
MGENKASPIKDNKNPVNFKRYAFKDLPEPIKHLAENGVINLLPLSAGEKRPSKNWKAYQSKKYPLERLKRHRGNFGIVTGDPLDYGLHYLTILDIDDKKGESGVYQYVKNLDTLQVKTASKGYHIYLWSSKEVKDKDYLSRLFDLDIELRGTSKGLIVSAPSFVKYEDGTTGSHKVIKNGSNYPILALEDAEEFIKNILVNNGFIPKEGVQHTGESQEHSVNLKIDHKRWKRELNSDEIKDLVTLLQPLYSEGNRHDLVLYLSGWMYKAEIGSESAIKVIMELCKEDEEIESRLTSLKYTYMGFEGKKVKGSSGVWNIIKSHYSQKYLESEESKIEEATKRLHIKLKTIIVAENSKEGIRRYLKIIKDGGNGQSKAIKKIHHFLRARYPIIKEEKSGELAIYNPENGYYEFHDDNKFHEFLSEVFEDEIFTMDESKKLKSIFAKMRSVDDSHIVFENGILNVETLELENFTPDYFLTFKVPYNWNPEAKGNYVEEKVKEILGTVDGNGKEDERNYQNYLELLGYILAETGNPRQKIFLYIGPPGTGKTQLINLIAGLVKGGVSSVPLQQFKDRFGLQSLIGKRVNTLFDISEEEINDPSVIKAVSGNDSITIERKFKESVTFENGLPVKTVGAGNVLPKIKDETQAMARRLNITQLQNNFSRAPVENLSDKLMNDREGMEWLIYTSICRYYNLKQDGGNFSLDFTPEEMRLQYLKLSDPCRYALECLYEFSNNENDFYTSTELITSINNLLAEEGLRIPKDTKNNHNPAIRELGGEYVQRRVNGDRIWGYCLIKAKSPNKDPKNHRLDKESLIMVKPSMRRQIALDGTDEEKNMLDLMDGMIPINLTGVVIDARNEFNMSKSEVMSVLNKWKKEGALIVDNSIYKKD